MRKSRDEAAQTRRRIVEAASSEFRKSGIVATGLNDLMKAAGLTLRGLYFIKDRQIKFYFFDLSVSIRGCAF